MTAPATGEQPDDETQAPPVVRTVDLVKDFPVTQGSLGRVRGRLRAVGGVTLSVHPGETVGLVGESGCGKTTFGRVLLRLLEPTSGRIEFEGRDITNLSQRALRPLRRRMQIVFQDPYSSLNPRMTVRAALGEAMRIHGLANGGPDERDKVAAVLEQVGLRPDHMSRYPHEFSGGQRQRIGIARALAVEPAFIVADEPVSALDVSIQAQIVNLLQDLQDSLGLSFLFIAHDLKLVEHLSHRVAVMYLGQIVELGAAERIYREPLHPYTQALLSAVPVPDPERKAQRILLEGDVPSPADPPAGCPFHPRCPKSEAGLCDLRPPSGREVSPGHSVSCHLV